MSRQQKVWEDEFAGACKVIENANAVITFDDGFQAIDQSKVPASVVRYYNGLLSTGYAKGWL